MFKILPSEYSPALALFGNSLHQMKLNALAEGSISGQVWTDSAEPSVTAVMYQNKILIASDLDPQALTQKLKPLLMEQLYERRMGWGSEEAMIFWDGEGVREGLMTALQDKCPAYALREYYELADPSQCRAADVPEGYEIVPVDGALLAKGYGNTEELKNEMCSERISVEAFLAGSFGVCAVKDNELAGWCLSEYNCKAGCEVGIEVVEGHRRKKLALAMVSAFAREAGRRGVQRIGWHCFKYNLPSAATALSAGFKKVLEYGELMCFYNPALQYAVNGNFADGEGRLEEAVGWYNRAVSENNAPLWVYIRLAMALASQNLLDSAFHALETAIFKGFSNWGWLRVEPRLEPLRVEDRWRQLF